MKQKQILALILTICLLVSAFSTTLAATSGMPCGHSWDDERSGWRDADCTHEGGQYGYCSVCGAIVWDEFVEPALGHKWGKMKTVQDPTCTEQGKEQRTCSRCGKTESKAISALGHKWGEWKIVKEATPTEAGLRERVCSRCALVQQEAYYVEGTLKKGDKGDDVQKLQEALNEQGYDCGKADGIFGSKTEDALKDYEQDHGYEEDGIGWPGLVNEIENGAGSLAQDDDYTAGLELAKIECLASVSAAEGDTVTAELRAVNTGSVYLTINAIRMFDGNGQFADGDQFAFGADNTSLFGPGDESPITYSIRVTADDVARGEIIRTVSCGAGVWEDKETGKAATPDRAKAADTLTVRDRAVNSNEVELHIALGEAEEAVYSLEIGIVAEPMVLSAAEGDDVSVPMNVTNTGDVCLFVYETDILDGNGNPTTDYVDDDILASFLKPGTVSPFDFHITITAEDLENGAIRRSIRRKGEVYQDSVTGFAVTAAAAEADGNFVVGDRCAYSNVVEIEIPLRKREATLEKTVTNQPINGMYYTLGEKVEYSLLFTNEAADTLVDFEIDDPLHGENEDMAVVREESVAGFATVSVSFEYTVTQADVENGYIENAACAFWYDPIRDLDLALTSNEVVVLTGTPDGILLTKSLADMPENGMYFTPGESVVFRIHIQNQSDMDYYMVDVYDLLESRGDPIRHYPEILSGFEDEFLYAYVVTEEDVLLQEITNVAVVDGYDRNREHFMENSNRVIVPVGTDGDPMWPFGVISDLAVDKIETSAPANGVYYTEGETIEYLVTYTNCGEIMLGETVVYDTLKADGNGEIGYAEHLYPGESRTCTFTHTVTAADVKAGYVVNGAIAEYDEGGYIRTAISQLVISDTDGLPDKENHGFLTGEVHLPGEGEDYRPCERRVIGTTDSSITYDMFYCPIHSPTKTMVDSMLEAADTDELKLAAYQYARTMWQQHIEDLYAAVYDAADSRGKVMVVFDRISFHAMAIRREAALNALYPEDAVLVAGEITQLLEDKCVDLCNELHTAPGERVDSIARVRPEAGEAAAECAFVPTEEGYVQNFCPTHALTHQMSLALLAKYDSENTWNMIRTMWQIELNTTGKALCEQVAPEVAGDVAADFVLFENYVDMRADFLRMLYGEDEAVAAEVSATEYRNRATQYCTEMQ